MDCLPPIFFKKIRTVISQWICIACISLVPSQVIAEKNIIIVSSDKNKHHQSLVENILSNLETSDIKTETFLLGQTININTKDKLIISLGQEASSLINKKVLANPKLRVFTDANPHIDPERKSESHLSMTQSICQQFALINLINSDWKIISILLSTGDKYLAQSLSLCAKQYNLKTKTIILDKYINIIDALNSSLSKNDVILALPDPTIYNSRTIKSILLTSYRHRVPIIGFSENFVRAGALAAMHSSTKQLSKQITELIKKHFNDENIDSHFYPKYFDVVTNKNVAKSLGINIPDRKVLTEKLQLINNE